MHPATVKPFARQHFGFPVEIINGNRVTDKRRTMCKHCEKVLPYAAANTGTMHGHLQNHHGSLLKSTAPVNKALKRPDNADSCLFRLNFHSQAPEPRQ
ncbi:hypothetical protein F2P81_004907 [Scophthalmus maximus]|uniref:BED-type domain-containing protein n=1 Tax=Scophthalmus maximus TaxID=52904 RepID=A0A6A4TIN0_SCOMX|nr:hypothetical protein F2P81_004907 [Scophthalmus maximus]